MAHDREGDREAEKKRADDAQRDQPQPRAPAIQRRELAAASHLAYDVSKPNGAQSWLDKVQRTARPGGGAGADSAAVHRAAAHGTSGAGGPLPHLDQIRRSFGRHDVSHVQAHTDGAAAEGAAAMGARAFASGDHVAFGGAADLHTAAHEAAHVVQQRGGVQLKGGVGQAGDSYERHADEVADRVVAGQSAEALLDGVAGKGGGAASAVQRFESEEHQHLGDLATNSAKYNVGGGKDDPFELTHGDIVALSGDMFAPEELFDLAAKPGNRGQKPGTRDEILWALQDETIWEMRAAKSGPYAGKKDPRFQAGGPYAGYVFSNEVKTAVQTRYQKLAAANQGHFAAPHGRDGSGAPVPTDDSAGGNYHRLHELALRMAFEAGKGKGDIGPAMAREAAAHHFLTDSFSAGHLRTPVADIRDYWGKKYPLFWYNLRHKIALDTAIEMVSGTPITNHYAYQQILAQVEGVAGALPAITLGDLVALIFHNVDNEKGVSVGGGVKVMGDAHLDDATTKLAVAAIQAGNAEVQAAYDLGGKGGDGKPDAIYAAVKAKSGSGDRYSAETKTPTPAADAESQNWKAPNIEALWDQPMLGKGGDTVGKIISDMMTTGAMAIQLAALAEKFPESQSGLHPRKAYLAGFRDKLVQNPRAGLMDIIHWAPHDMSTGDAAGESAKQLEQNGKNGGKETMDGLTLESRVKYLGQLLDNDDKEEIVRIFETAPSSERATLYMRVEGHDWKGDFSRHLGSRDKLYKALDGDRVERLKKVINGG